jgi:hypothetical protein
MLLEQEILTAIKSSIPTTYPPFWECCFKPIVASHPIVAVAVISGSIFGAGAYYMLNKSKKAVKN